MTKFDWTGRIAIRRDVTWFGWMGLGNTRQGNLSY